MKNRTVRSIFFPLILIILGLGFLLGNSGVWDFGNIISDWWPLCIILAGILSFISNPRAFTGPLIIFIIGSVLLFSSLDLLHGDIFNYLWPLIIIAIGLSIIFKRTMERSPGESTDTVRIFCAFSGQERRVTSAGFKNADITVLFGGASLDLRDAHITDGATIEVFAAFGGCDILVPKTCKVVVDGLPLFGGWEDKTTSDPKSTVTLRISGTVLFGGVGIKNEK